MSDDEGLTVRAFHVDNSHDSYELDLPPTSGIEYLRRVQMEAKQCPDVVVADLDFNALNKKQTVKVEMTNGCLPAPSGFAPSLQWQRHQVADFSEVRQKLVKFKAACKNKKQSPNLPYAEDSKSWCQLCFGKSQKEAAPPDDAVNDSGGNSIGSPPLLSMVAGLNQATIMQVLEHHLHWFDSNGFSEPQGRWFYALLCCLEKPLPPEACSLLRRFIRSCTTIRASLESTEDKTLPALNLFICLVARYFDQMDLVDNT